MLKLVLVPSLEGIAADDYKLINKTSFAYLYISNGIACPLMHNEPNYMTVPIGPGEIGYMVMEPSF